MAKLNISEKTKKGILIGFVGLAAYTFYKLSTSGKVKNITDIPKETIKETEKTVEKVIDITAKVEKVADKVVKKGFARFKKGSKEAKEYMASIRSKKKPNKTKKEE